MNNSFQEQTYFISYTPDLKFTEITSSYKKL